MRYGGKGEVQMRNQATSETVKSNGSQKINIVPVYSAQYTRKWNVYKTSKATDLYRTARNYCAY